MRPPDQEGSGPDMSDQHTHTNSADSTQRARGSWLRSFFRKPSRSNQRQQGPQQLNNGHHRRPLSSGKIYCSTSKITSTTRATATATATATTIQQQVATAATMWRRKKTRAMMVSTVTPVILTTTKTPPVVAVVTMKQIPPATPVILQTMTMVAVVFAPPPRRRCRPRHLPRLVVLLSTVLPTAKSMSNRYSRRRRLRGRSSTITIIVTAIVRTVGGQCCRCTYNGKDIL